MKIIKVFSTTSNTLQLKDLIHNP